MTKLTYQQLFDAFNACHINKASVASQQFKILAATPESMLNAISTIRTLGTPAQIHMHKTSYLRGMIIALHKNTWNQTHANKLINTADWFVALQGKPTKSVPYSQQLRILLKTIQQKVQVPPQKAKAWADAVAYKTVRNYIPKCKFGLPDPSYTPTCRHLPMQNLCADDRN